MFLLGILLENSLVDISPEYPAKDVSAAMYRILQKCNTHIHVPDKSKFRSLSSFFLLNIYI